MSGPSLSASFVYDGDGNRVQSTINGVTTTFVGNYYEVSGATVTKYYYAGASRIAMSVNSTVYYLLSDQLGSTSITTDSSGGKVSEVRYDAWGSVRYSNGATPTKYMFTGQYSNVPDFGLMFYNARWYDGALGRFTSADTIVPPGVQGWDRYAYASNSPVVYTDPSGHFVCPDVDPCTPSQSGGDGDAGDSGGNDYQPNPAVPAWTYVTSCVGNLGQCYLGGWDNFWSAWSISTNPDATVFQRIAANMYMAAWLDAHVVVVAGTTAIVVSGVMEVVGGGAAACAADAARCEQAASTAIGETGDLGEEWLAQFGGEPQRYFPTTQGGRFVDQLINGMAYESKVGYTTLTQEISLQIAKDVELIHSGAVRSVTWVFFQSPATGGWGPSAPLFNLLDQNGIGVFYASP